MAFTRTHITYAYNRWRCRMSISYDFLVYSSNCMTSTSWIQYERIYTHVCVWREDRVWEIEGCAHIHRTHTCNGRLTTHSSRMEYNIFHIEWCVRVCCCVWIWVCVWYERDWGITNEHNPRKCQSAFWGFAAKLCAGTEDRRKKRTY